MTIHSAEIEAIVKVVLQRLKTVVAPMDAEAADTAERVPTAKLPSTPAHAEARATEVFRLDSRLVTLEMLRGQLAGINTVQVHPKAIVTPAVMDELRAKNIRLIRDAQANTTSSARYDQRMLVVWEAQKLSPLAASFECLASSHHSSADVGRIAAHLNSGGLAALWCTRTPFAAIRAAATNPVLKAVQIERPEDLVRATREAEPNVIIVDDTRWQPTQLTHLAHEWAGRLP